RGHGGRQPQGGVALARRLRVGRAGLVDDRQGQVRAAGGEGGEGGRDVFVQETGALAAAEDEDAQGPLARGGPGVGAGQGVGDGAAQRVARDDDAGRGEGRGGGVEPDIDRAGEAREEAIGHAGGGV